MTREKKTETRRNVLKKSAAVGTVVAGAGAAAGTAAAKPSVNIDQQASSLTTGGSNTVTGGLIAINVSGVSLNALNQNNVTVQIGGDVVEISDITVTDVADLAIVLENIDVDVAALNDVNVSVAILGSSGISDTATFDLSQ